MLLIFGIMKHLFSVHLCHGSYDYMCLHNLLRHAFSRLRHFYCFSQSHYRICFILLVSILSLLHTFLLHRVFSGSKSYTDISQFYNIYSFPIQSVFLLFLTNLSSIVARLTALYFHSPYPVFWKNIFGHISYLLP